MSRRMVWTNRKIERLAECAAAGMTTAQTAEFLGLSLASVTRKAFDLRVSFSGQRKAGKRWTPEEDEILRRLAKQGYGWTAIAYKMTRGIGGVAKRARTLGIRYRPGMLKRTRTQRAEPEKRVKRRRCLIGGEMFDARIDENGRLLEYSCSHHRAWATREEAGALI